MKLKRVKRGQFQNFQKSRGLVIPKIARNKRDYWLITPNQQTFCIKTKQRAITDQRAGNHKIIPLTVQC